jgi:hypothetical protein
MYTLGLCLLCGASPIILHHIFLYLPISLPTEKNICVISEEDYYDDGPPHLIPFGGCSVTCGGGMQLQEP